MNFLKKAAFCYIAPLLSVCSLATSQLEAQCDPAPCCIDWCSLVVPALVGAAAGAATGAAVNHRGKHGKQGERGRRGEKGDEGQRGHRGPEGDNPFIRDTEHTLQFDFTISSINFTGEAPDGASIVPYVCTPDGKIVTGTEFSFVNSGTTATTVIKLATPVYGDYVFGLEVPGTKSPVTISYLLSALPLFPAPNARLPTTYSGSATLTDTSHSQIPFNFTYGPVGTVPSP